MIQFFEKYSSTRKRVLLHFLFWLSYVAMYAFIYGSFEDTYGAEFFWATAYLPLKALAVYFTLYFIIPKYFLNKKYLQASLLFILFIIFVAFIQRIVNWTIIYPNFHPEWMTEYMLFVPKILKLTLGIYPVVVLAAFIKIAKHFYSEESKAKELHQEKLQAELNFLKGQIHPHFLFNTLNNLYALTLKKSESSPEVVLKLSELLSFMLYECNSRTVPLSKELKLLENYIALEKIRYDERLTVTYETFGDVARCEIPPMLLLPFVENAFKHGTSDTVDSVWVEINIVVRNQSLSLSVKNSNGKNSTETEEFDYQKGIGLKNVARRLELLYGDSYDLKIEDNSSHYSVSLSVELDQLLKQEQD